MLSAPAYQASGSFELVRNSNFLPGPITGAPLTPTASRARDDTAQLIRLKRYARRALGAIAPFSVIAERTFKTAESCITMLAAALPHGRRLPRSTELVRLAIASGAGLRLRSIGGLAVVVIEIPLAPECMP